MTDRRTDSLHTACAHNRNKGMKANFVLHRFTFAALSLIALATAFPTRALAQSAGKTGTTIVFDKSTSHGLFGSQASGSGTSSQFFTYLRHDITHVQMQSSNKPALGDKGTGTFASNDNDMRFETSNSNYLSVTNYFISASSYYNHVYLAVVAPKGYRFTRYQWEIDKAIKIGTTTTVSTASICQYTYDANGNVKPMADSLKITSGLDKWDVTLNQGSNILYFRTTSGNTSAAVSILMKSLKLTYVIDQPFENQLPGTDLSENIHTGLLDLGEFSANGNGFISFNYQTPASDLQEVAFYQGSNGTVSVVKPNGVTVGDDQYYVAASNGDYYVEAPKKFRVIGAKLNFLKKDVSGTKTELTYTDKTSITSGSKYIISDGNGHYLSQDGSDIITDTDPAKATEWTISGSSYNGYTIKSGNYYLTLTSSYGLTLSSSSNYSWKWNSSYGFYYTYSYGWYTTYYVSLVYNDGWVTSSTTSSSSRPSNANKLQTRTTTTTTGVSYTAGNFTATPYTRENTAMDAVSLSDDNTSATVDLTNYNNDAIHFSISGLGDDEVALYNVSLMLLPLNPELHNLSVASKASDGTIRENTTSFTSENFIFNSGNAVTVIVPQTESGKECSVVFQNAFNEDRTNWYTTGVNENDPTKDNYSNYFLIGSDADNGGTSSVSLDINKTPSHAARTSAQKAGTAKLTATNIEQVIAGTSKILEDKNFSKADANYADAKLTADGDNVTYYIYTSDVPTWNIMPTGTGTQHIDYRYYTLNVNCKVQKEEPVVTIVPVYTSTLKSENHKNTSIKTDGGKPDTKTFFGVKVTAKVADGSYGTAEGYLTSEQVVKAISEAVAKKAKDDETFIINADDALRGMLYLDLSSLKSVDYAKFDEDFNNSTADNCLYFMYPGFHRDQVQNTISKLANGTFEATSNIVVLDQQPFFTPYDFTTGGYTVTYEREGTSNATAGTNQKVKNMAVVLPFDVQLDGEGHLKNASDEVNQDNITYYNITGSGNLTSVSKDEPHQGLTYGVKATKTSDDKAEANKPYYVTTDAEGFKYVVSGANFKASGSVSTNGKATPAELVNTPAGSWTAVGTYAGVQPKAGATEGKGKWYFSKDFFWNAAQLSQNKHFNIRPFRAYFVTTDQTNDSKAQVVFNDTDIKPTGIHGVTADSYLLISASHGAITVKAQANAAYAIYTVAGQTVAKGLLTAGESRCVNVPQGVYVVNNQKIIVK